MVAGIEQNYNFLNLTGSTRGVGSIGYTPAVSAYGGGENTGSVPMVNLESKVGTSNQSFVLPGRESIVARNFDMLG